MYLGDEFEMSGPNSPFERDVLRNLPIRKIVNKPIRNYIPVLELKNAADGAEFGAVVAGRFADFGTEDGSD